MSNKSSIPASKPDCCEAEHGNADNKRKRSIFAAILNESPTKKYKVLVKETQDLTMIDLTPEEIQSQLWRTMDDVRTDSYNNEQQDSLEWLYTNTYKESPVLFFPEVREAQSQEPDAEVDDQLVVAEEGEAEDQEGEAEDEEGEAEDEEGEAEDEEGEGEESEEESGGVNDEQMLQTPPSDQPTATRRLEDFCMEIINEKRNLTEKHLQLSSELFKQIEWWTENSKRLRSDIEWWMQHFFREKAEKEEAKRRLKVMSLFCSRCARERK